MANVLNYVLNLSGVSAFTSGVQKAGNAMADSFARAHQSSKAASQALKITSDVVSASMQKMGAQVDLAGAGIDRFKLKMQTQAATLAQSRAEYAAASADVAKWQGSVEAAQAILNKLQSAAVQNKGAIASWSGQVAQATAQLQQAQAAQNIAAAAVQKGTVQENYMAASLKNREARQTLLTAKLQQTEKAQNSQVTGLLKLIKSFEQAVTWVDRLVLTFRKIELTLQRVGKLWDWLTGKQHTATKQMASVGPEVTGPLGRIQSAVTTMVPGVGLLGQAFAQFLGQLAANAVQFLVSSLAQIPQQAVAAVSSFERMSMSIGAMVANQRMQTGEFQSMNEALAASKKPAADLIKWMEKLAIQSPFSVEDVKQSFQMALGFGFAAGEAQKLTTSMLNWAAATGKSGFEMEMVSRVMGQIRAQGKMMGNDLFQLANAGIGMDTVNRQLAKDLGKTTEEIIRLREAGKITGEQTLTALTNYMNSFGDAAKAQANTLSGLLSSLGDIGPIFMRNFLGPMSDAQDRVEGVIGAIQKRLIGFVGFLQQDWVIDMARQFGIGLGNIADNALAWGEAVTQNFATGLWNGVVAVLDALTNIGNLVAYWLSPGSPPKLLPDLDTWGAETIGEYFKGFMKGDLGIFSDLSNLVGDAIKSAGGTEKGDQPGIFSAVLGSREIIGRAIAQVRQAGAVTQDILQGIVASWGGGQSILEAYTRTTLELALQSDKVATAQEELNRVTKVYDDQLAAIDDQLTGVENAQSDFVDQQKKSQYELILNDPSATLAEKEQARYEIQKLNLKKQRREVEAEKKVAITAAEAKLSAELERQKQLEDQLATQKELLGIQREQNQLTRDLADALKKAAEAGGKGAGGKGKEAAAAKKPGAFGIELPAPEEFNPFQGMLDALTAKIQGVQTAWTQAWAAITDKLAPAKASFDSVVVAVGNLLQAFADFGPRAQQYVADMVVFVTQQLGLSLPEIFGNVRVALEQLTLFWKNHGDQIMEVVNFVFRVIVTVITGALTLLSGLVAAFTKAINGDWHGLWQTVLETISFFIAEVLNITGTSLEEFIGTWVLVHDTIVAIWNRLWSGLTKIAEDQLVGFVNLGKAIIDGITAGVIAAAVGLASSVISAVTGAIRAAKDAIQGKSPSQVTRRLIGQPIGEGIVQGILDTLPLMAGATARLVSVPASAMQQAGASYNYANTTNFNYNPTYGAAPNQPSRDFATMRALYGGR